MVERPLLTEYRPLLTEDQSLLREDSALLTADGALWTEYVKEIAAAEWGLSLSCPADSPGLVLGYGGGAQGYFAIARDCARVGSNVF